MQYTKIKNAKSFLQEHEKFYNNILKNINLFSKKLKEHNDYLNSISAILKSGLASNENLKMLLSKEKDVLLLEIKRKKNIFDSLNKSFTEHLTIPIKKNIADYKKEIFQKPIEIAISDAYKCFLDKESISNIPSGDGAQFSKSEKWYNQHQGPVLETSDVYLSVKRFNLKTNSENNQIDYSILFRPVFIPKGKPISMFTPDNLVGIEYPYYLRIQNSIILESSNVFDLSDYHKIMKSYGLKIENFNSLSFSRSCSHTCLNKIKIFDDYQTNIEEIKEDLIKEFVFCCN